MAVEKWNTPGTWTTVFGAEVNSLANGNAVLASTSAIDNTSDLDMFMDISVSLGSFTPAAPNFISFYIHPLNQDGTTYGDGRFGSAAAGPPASMYFAGSIILVAAAQVQTGIAERIIIPPNQFKLVLYSRAGAALAASSNTIKYRKYDRAVI